MKSFVEHNNLSWRLLVLVKDKDEKKRKNGIPTVQNRGGTGGGQMS